MPVEGHAGGDAPARQGDQLRHHLRHLKAFGLANQLSIPQDEEPEAYIKTYFERFPGIRAYMDGMRATVRAQGYVTTLFGRKIHIPAATSKSVHDRQFAERAAINAPIQGARRRA